LGHVRALVAGCGYIGLAVAKELIRLGHEVSGMRRTPAASVELEQAGIRPLIVDITRADDLKRLPPSFDWVVNCTSSSGGDVDEYRSVYIEGNRNLVGWLTGSPVRKFVYTSSTSVYGQVDGAPVDETSPTEPDAETAKVLLDAEEVLLTAAMQRGQGPVFPAVVLRVAGIYGPGRGYWFKQFVTGQARIEGKGERVSNMVHRDDVAGAVVCALERGVPGRIYNVVDNRPVTQLELFQSLASRSGKPLPPFVTAEEGPGLRKRGLTNKRVSNARLRQELGYELRYPTFEEGIEL